VVQELRKAIDVGRFGKLSHAAVNIRWNRTRDYYSQAPWRGTWAQDGGTLMNQCIHGIDLLLWMMGDCVESVYGSTRRQLHSYIEAEDVGVAVLQFKNGAVATIEGTANIYPRNLEETLFISGEYGTVRLGGTSVNSIDVWNFRDSTADDANKHGFVEQTPNVYGNGHILLYKDVIKALQTGHKPYIDAAAGRRALEVVLAIYKSSKTNQPVRLPLTEFGTMNMEGFFTHTVSLR
jgi:predicted dehydrogenase